jgi:DNA repair protein SbcC/Rad50
VIPQQLTLKNFLSYRDATLDFRGLHVACICGANGAGKSSLLEAIAWAVWGESRAHSEDDVIHLGAAETKVDFTFQSHQHCYRIIRTRFRTQATTLEFQVETPSGFRSLTEKGIRATQQLILQHLKLDYDTFINSAYLRQGRADEFMLKRPGDRKQILADLLKLTQYDELAERSKERVRELKGEHNVFQRQLDSIQEQLQQRDSFIVEEASVRVALTQLQQQQETDIQRSQQLQAAQQQRQTWQQQLTWQQQQQQELQRDCQRIERDVVAAQQQQQQLTAILQQAEAIAQHYAQFQQLQAEEEQLSAQSQTHQTLQTQLHQVQQKQTEQINHLNRQLHQVDLQLDALNQQQQEVDQVLAKAEDIETALAQLRQARQRLTELDQLQVKAVPLMQRKQQLQTEYDRLQARCSSKLEDVRSLRQHLETEQQRYPRLQAQLNRLNKQVEHLEQRQKYQTEVREKGVERRSFLERLQERQRDYEQQIDGLNQKIALLTQSDQPAAEQNGELTTVQAIAPKHISEKHTQENNSAENDVERLSPVLTLASDGETALVRSKHNNSNHNNRDKQSLKVSSPYAVFQVKPLVEVEQSDSDPSEYHESEHYESGHHESEHHETAQAIEQLEQQARSGKSKRRKSKQPAPQFPPCPLCDRPLDEHHWEHVLEHHQQEKEEIEAQLWVLREQLTTSDREIRLLRQEYRDVDKELVQYGAVLEQRGRLQQQMRSVVEAHQRLQQVIAEEAELARSLQEGDYGAELHPEWQFVHQSLADLNYDDRNHALARGETDRWRWAEIRHAEVRQAQRRQAQIAERQPQLIEKQTELQQKLEAIATAPLQRQLDSLQQKLEAIAYAPEHHAQVRKQLKQAQVWQMRQQDLHHAQQQFPQVQQRLQELNEHLSQRHQALQTVNQQIESLCQQLDQIPDPDADLQAIALQIQQRREQLDEQIARLATLEEQQRRLEDLSNQSVAIAAQLAATQKQLQVYQELSQAFGKNGIQALMIENVLPQLEAETNQILGRLSANQLHVQFVTQKSNRSNKSKQQPKLIETLDILISDLQGTRPYETYSGGEAFRVNFSIRLALAQLLAQRSGMPLQLLIIDEGFGTQDEAGCDRLISAINAIAPDFACILTVTHMPHLKEAFQTRIEVQKSQTGSRLQLLG